VLDPLDVLVTTGVIGTSVTILGTAQGKWTVTIPSAGGHYVIDKTSGADRGIYIDWAKLRPGQRHRERHAEQRLAILGSVPSDRRKCPDWLDQSRAPGPPFTGSGTLSLDVGEYKLSVVSRGRVVGPITVKVSCNGNRNPTFDLPLLGVDIDLKPGSFPNSINLNGNGVQAVAVFGALKFKVEDIDLNTVLFGVTGTEASPVHRGHVQERERRRKTGHRVPFPGIRAWHPGRHAG